MDNKTALVLLEGEECVSTGNCCGVYDNQRAVSSDKRVFILTRSGFAGQQRWCQCGRATYFTWENFRNQIPAGLNFSMTGIPHWNSDIGGSLPVI